MVNTVHSAHPRDTNLERTKNIATIFSAIAIPIVLTIAGYFIQRQITNESLKKDYVGIAASILKEDSKKQEPELREWAVKVLDDNSPVPFSKKAKEGLLSGTYIVVPGPAWFGPPDGCREPPAKRTILEDYMKLAKDVKSLDHEESVKRLEDFIENVYRQERDVLIMRINLKCLQDWANLSEQSDIKYRKSIGAPSSKSVMENIRKDQAARTPKDSDANSGPASTSLKH